MPMMVGMMVRVAMMNSDEAHKFQLNYKRSPCLQMVLYVTEYPHVKQLPGSGGRIKDEAELWTWGKRWAGKKN